jgi:hypothetical protein
LTGQTIDVAGGKIGNSFQRIGNGTFYFTANGFQRIREEQTNVVTETVEVAGGSQDDVDVGSVSTGVSAVTEFLEESVGNFNGGTTTIPDAPTDWDWGPGGEGNPNSDLPVPTGDGDGVPDGAGDGTGDGVGDGVGDDASTDWKGIAIFIGINVAKYKINQWLNGEEEQEGNYVYRALAPTDFPSNGLFARNPNANYVSPISHVAGKRDSPWISTTKDVNVAINKYDKGNGVVMIDLDQVNSEVIDLSNGIPGFEGSMHSNWSKKDQEVLIRGYIPAKAITRIK